MEERGRTRRVMMTMRRRIQTIRKRRRNTRMERTRSRRSKTDYLWRIFLAIQD